jgi:hypothetical protein
MSIPGSAGRLLQESAKTANRGTPMKYLCLAYYNTEQFAAMKPDDMQALIGEQAGWCVEVRPIGFFEQQQQQQ